MPTKIAIIAGGGDLPLKIANNISKDNLVIIALSNYADSDFSDYNYYISSIAKVGKIIDILKHEQAKEIIFAGGIKRPSFHDLQPDKKGMELLARITKNKLFGDNSVLSTVAVFLEEHGFIVRAPEYYNKNLISEAGVLTSRPPSKQDSSDISLAKKVILAISELDIGQAAIVEDNIVLGIEAAEGTDILIERCGRLKKEPKQAGVLVKMKKPTQDIRLDLPSIGINTIINIHQAGFSGIAIEAGSSLVIDKKAIVDYANKHDLFILVE